MSQRLETAYKRYREYIENSGKNPLFDFQYFVDCFPKIGNEETMKLKKHVGNVSPLELFELARRYVMAKQKEEAINFFNSGN